jgi:hypothetical protein
VDSGRNAYTAEGVPIPGAEEPVSEPVASPSLFVVAVEFALASLWPIGYCTLDLSGLKNKKGFPVQPWGNVRIIWPKYHAIEGVSRPHW